MAHPGSTCMGIFPFKPPYESLFDSVVYPVIQTVTGLACEDARLYYEASQVKMYLIAEMIERTRLVVVDISEKNPNVFFEFGIGYSLRKPAIILCSKNMYEKKTWKRKPPFDIQGRELLIYEDEQDLRLKLGRHALDSLYDTSHTSVAWRSKNGKNHVKSATSLEFVCDGEIWSSEPVHENFTIRYKVTINKCTNTELDPDIRLLVAAQDGGFPRVVVIFPWGASSTSADHVGMSRGLLRGG